MAMPTVGQAASTSAMMANSLVFEFPLSERVRTWLRLEEQFMRCRNFAARRDPLDHRLALISLFELIETATRSDVKTDLLQELDRQRAMWTTQSSNPDIEGSALVEFLHDLDIAIGDLHAQVGRPGHHLRDMDWLAQLRQRAASPGGACEFELPMLGAWLAQPESERKANLREWTQPVAPLEEATSLALRLLRGSGPASREIALQGSFQRTLDGGRVPLLAIVSVEPQLQVVPELSANRHAISIRWMEHGGRFTQSGRAPSTCRDIPFQLTLCRL